METVTKIGMKKWAIRDGLWSSPVMWTSAKMNNVRNTSFIVSLCFLIYVFNITENE